MRTKEQVKIMCTFDDQLITQTKRTITMHCNWYDEIESDIHMMMYDKYNEEQSDERYEEEKQLVSKIFDLFKTWCFIKCKEAKTITVKEIDTSNNNAKYEKDLKIFR